MFQKKVRNILRKGNKADLSREADQKIVPARKLYILMKGKEQRRCDNIKR